MHDWGVLLEVVLLLASAAALGFALEKLGQSAIMGYFAAGILLGPKALGWIGRGEVVSALADLGVILLMFSTGLEFSLAKLRKVSAVAAGGGSLQIALTAALAGGAGLALGLDPAQAFAIGAVIAPSSTAFVIRTITQRSELDSVHGRNAIGITLFQNAFDIPLIILLTVLGGAATGGEGARRLAVAAGFTVALMAGLYVIAGLVLPRLFHATAMAGNRELPVILATVTCLGCAALAARLEVAPALGAFVAGMLLAESPFATQIRADVGSLRTLFVTLFFSAFGMLVDVGWLGGNWQLVLALVPAIVIGKTLIVFLIMLGFGNSPRNALATGLCLSPLDEFSFVLAQIGLSAGVLSVGAFQAVVSAAVVTLAVTPYLVALAPRAGALAERALSRLGLVRNSRVSGSARAAPPSGHVLVVGCGPAGRGVVTALREAGLRLVVTELNPRTVARARESGVEAHVGDATLEEVLAHAGVASARAVVITVPDHRTALQVMRQVRVLGPQATVVVRSRYHMYAADFVSAGAHVVVDEEEEVGRLLGLETLEHVSPPAAASARPDEPGSSGGGVQQAPPAGPEPGPNGAPPSQGSERP